jgi:GMP synthase (glutamine-hydrolysing)
VTSTPKTLLVNCYLNRREVTGLKKAIEPFSQCAVVLYEDIGECYPVGDEFDAVVLSGSEARIVKEADRAKYLHIVELIETCNVPLLGICFGHQLLAWSLGAKVSSLKSHFEGFEQVRVVCADTLFEGFTETQIPLAENHFDSVQKDSLGKAGFKLLADSASCEVEAIKHISKPFFGVQFHPERITLGIETHPEGHQIIGNFYAAKVKRRGT